MSEEAYYQRKKPMILKRAKDENNQKVLRERARNKYRELFEEEKDVKRQYQKIRYHNM